MSQEVRASSRRLLRIVPLLLFPAWFAFAGAGDAEEPPALLPPYPEIPPTYWEENRVWIVAVGVIAVLVLAALVWLLARKQPAKAVPPDIEAKQALDALSQLPEDGRVVSQVSQVLKRYFIAAFGLPAAELTTAEFRLCLAENEQIEGALADAVGEFLQRCDQYKFAPVSEGAPGAALQARRFVEEAEARRVRVAEDASAKPTKPELK